MKSNKAKPQKNGRFTQPVHKRAYSVSTVTDLYSNTGGSVFYCLSQEMKQAMYFLLPCAYGYEQDIGFVRCTLNVPAHLRDPIILEKIGTMIGHRSLIFVFSDV